MLIKKRVWNSMRKSCESRKKNFPESKITFGIYIQKSQNVDRSETLDLVQYLVPCLVQCLVQCLSSLMNKMISTGKNEERSPSPEHKNLKKSRLS